MKRHLITILFVLTVTHSFGQTKKQLDSIRIVLEQTLITDQQYRDQWDSVQSKYGFNSPGFIELLKKTIAQDSINMITVGNIINKYGWLGKEQTSPDANDALFLVIQHATLPSQLTYLPVMKKAVAEKKAKATDYALLVDRTNMRQGKFQIYGSQINSDANGHLHIFPIFDEPNLNRRRKSVGLPPMQEYFKKFNQQLAYSLPKTDKYKNKIVINGSAKDIQQNQILPNVGVYFNNVLIAKTDSSGFFETAIDSRYKGRAIVFRKQNFELFTFITNLSSKDVIEINPLLRKIPKKD
jgi:hypothetical protein